MIESRFPVHTVGIAGMGLIGGSMAKAIHAGEEHRHIYCADHSMETLLMAESDGIADDILDARTAQACDLVILALYPEAAVNWLQTYAGAMRQGTVVVDCCGVKRTVDAPMKAIAAEHGLIYVGGHPMAGTEKSGYAASRSDLFRGASMILMADAPEDVRQGLEGFFLSLGFGSIKWSTPEEHDHIIAYTSQLAHVLSSAYVKSESALTHRGFSAGSFQDMTRVAYLNEDMWTELFLENADYLADEVDALADRLAEYAAAIREGRRENLRELLAEGRRRKELVEGWYKK